MACCGVLELPTWLDGGACLTGAGILTHLVTVALCPTLGALGTAAVGLLLRAVETAVDPAVDGLLLDAIDTVGHTLLLGVDDTVALDPLVRMVDTVGVGSLVEGGGIALLPAVADGIDPVLAGGALGAGGVGAGILCLVPV